MKVAVFSTKSYEKPFLEAANSPYQHALTFFDLQLNTQTAALTSGFDAVCCFVSDKLDTVTLTILQQNGVRLIALRSAGFNHVDIVAAKSLGLTVARVPAYSPYAVAEFAVALILTLNRKIHRAYHLVREQNFLLNHLMGFDLHGKTVGVVGTGKIGAVFAKIMQGFGCRVLAHDPVQNPACIKLGVQYLDLNNLYAQSDIISLHCPLTPNTQHLINAQALAVMKPGVMLINTGRGALIDSKAIIQALKTSHVGYLGIDVYEEEENLFFRDLSEMIIQDDIFARLMTFPNVVITGHQAFFTQEAVTNIAVTTLTNITLFETDPAKLQNNVVTG